MLRVAICDDEKDICQRLESMVLDYGDQQQIALMVDVYYDGSSLWPQISGVGHYDLIFLDIEMEYLSGIDLGKYIRKDNKDELTQIVYISWKQGYAMELFKIRPLDFLIKPLSVGDVHRNIHKSIELIGEQTQYFYYKVELEIRKIPSNRIVYFESDNRKIIMHTIDQEIEFYEKLEEVAARVDEKYFWRIHKSYLINYNHVEQFKYIELVMDNDRTLRISQSYRPEIRALQFKMMGKGEEHV